MKNFINFIFTVVLVLIASISTYAQDVIVTKNAEKISAQVTEIDVDVVRYKKFDNQEGPTYTVKKTEIATIIYQNGQVEVFEQQQQQQQQPYTKPQTSENINNNPDYVYFKSLNDDAMSAFLQNNDQECYQTFRTGEKFKITGKALLIPGIILTAGGFGAAIVGLCYWAENGYHWAWVTYWVGVSALAVGQSCIIASIPLMAVGGGMKAKAKNMYVDKYYKGKTSLNLNVLPNGIGFALKF
jgi:hypothetical protein